MEARGSSFEGVVSIADWYATFCGLAGVDPEDHGALEANRWLREHGLPTLFPIDSVDQWPAILNGTNARPGALALSNQSILEWPFKLVTGVQPYSLYTGPLFPNCSTAEHLVADGPVFVDLKIFDQRIDYSADRTEQAAVTWSHDCGAAGCLFNISADPQERLDLAADPLHADTLARLRAQLAEVKLFTPDRGSMALAACEAGVINGGFYGPFVDVEGFYTNLSTPSAVQRAKNAIYLDLVKNLNSSALQDKCVDNFKNKYQTKAGHFLLYRNLDKCVNKTSTIDTETETSSAVIASAAARRVDPVPSWICDLI